MITSTLLAVETMAPRFRCNPQSNADPLRSLYYDEYPLFIGFILGRICEGKVRVSDDSFKKLVGSFISDSSIHVERGVPAHEYRAFKEAHLDKRRRAAWVKGSKYYDLDMFGYPVLRTNVVYKPLSCYVAAMSDFLGDGRGNAFNPKHQSHSFECDYQVHEKPKVFVSEATCVPCPAKVADTALRIRKPMPLDSLLIQQVVLPLSMHVVQPVKAVYIPPPVAAHRRTFQSTLSPLSGDSYIDSSSVARWRPEVSIRKVDVTGSADVCSSKPVPMRLVSEKFPENCPSWNDAVVCANASSHPLSSAQLVLSDVSIKKIERGVWSPFSCVVRPDGSFVPLSKWDLTGDDFFDHDSCQNFIYDDQSVPPLVILYEDQFIPPEPPVPVAESARRPKFKSRFDFSRSDFLTEDEFREYKRQPKVWDIPKLCYWSSTDTDVFLEWNGDDATPDPPWSSVPDPSQSVPTRIFHCLRAAVPASP